MRTILILAACLKLAASGTPEKKIVCVFDPDLEPIIYIDPSLCTHLAFNWAVVSGGEVKARHWRDDGDNGRRDRYGKLRALRDEHPPLKTLIVLEGPVADFTNCSQIVYNLTCPETVADNIVKFAKRWSFNGVVLNWDYEHRYPVKPEFRSNIIELLKPLRMRCDREGLILTAILYGSEIFASQLYDVPEIVKYHHFINLGTFHYYGDLDRRTVHDSPLQAAYSETQPEKANTVEASTLYWLSQGVPRDKLIVGVSALGRLFTLGFPEENGVGAPATGASIIPRLGFRFPDIAYTYVCELHLNGGWNDVFDEEHRVPYTFKGDQWITYENVKSIREKAELIARLNLGGVMLLDMNADDYNRKCNVEKYPLLKTLNAVLRNGRPVSEELVPTVNGAATPAATPAIECTQSGYMLDPYSCGLIMCTPNTTQGYNQYHFECRPGNCNNPLIGKTEAETVDPNFFICAN